MPLPSTLSPLDRRVLRQLGGGTDAIESAKDAARHGADGGFPGFVYYHETAAFFRRNRAAMLGQLREAAGDAGMTSSELLASFRCLKGITDPLSALVDPKHEDFATVANALAWFALEACGSVLLNAEEEG